LFFSKFSLKIEKYVELIVPFLDLSLYIVCCRL
jgi:hypothetical protein